MASQDVAMLLFGTLQKINKKPKPDIGDVESMQHC